MEGLSPTAGSPPRRAISRFSGLLGLMVWVAVLPPGQAAGQDVPAIPPQDQVEPGVEPQPTPDQLPAPLPAEPPRQTRRGEDCEPVGYRVLSSVLQPGGTRMTQMGLPEFVCADGVRVRADSAVDFAAAGRIQFIGGFRYEDADRIMTATDADYFEVQGRLLGRGSVEVLSRDGQSEIRGDTLDLYEGFEGPEDDQLVVRGSPAFALFYPEEDEPGAAAEVPGDSAGVAVGADASTDDVPEEPVPDGATEEVEPVGPYELSGIVLRFNGEDFIHADGGAELVRDSLRGTADQLEFARASGVLRLMSNARVESEGSVFEGDEIELLLPNDELTAILVRGAGRLRTEDLALDASEIRIDMEDGEMRHLVAVRRAGAPVAPVSGDSVPSGPGGQPARAESDAFILVGDSIDVMSEDGVLRTAWAVGSARAVAVEVGEREGSDDSLALGVEDAADAVDPSADPIPADSIASETDEEEPETPQERTPETADSEQGGLVALLAEDWIEGDTIEVVFAPGSGPAEAEGSAYVLEGLIATGAARSLYRSPPEAVDADGRPAARPPREEWAISYMLADRIELTLIDGAVDNVRSTGNVVGEYLEPIRPPRVAGDSTSVSGDL